MVIGVLSLLGLLTVSSVRSLLHRSETATCASNMRRFYTGFIEYSQDNDGALPPFRLYNYPKPDGSLGSGPEWRQLLEPYLPGELRPRRNSLDNPGLDVCEAATFRGSGSYTYYYAINAYSTYTSPIHIPSVENPSRHFIFGESSGVMRITAAQFQSDMQFRHREKANLLFMDGRVENWDTTQIPIAGSTEYYAFWQGK